MANLFPQWSNNSPKNLIIAITLFTLAITVGATYYFTPKFSNVGYQPIQPVAFDHSLHAGQLAIDCRYCHTFVDRSSSATVPSSNTCMNCHNQVRATSPALEPIRQSYESGIPVTWIRIHKAPDYVYFNHLVHVNRGISCVECHGKVNEMSVVFQDKSLTMQFCLDCHRNPAPRIRPLSEVYNLNWTPSSTEDQLVMGKKFVHDWKVNPPLSCSGCHR